MTTQTTTYTPSDAAKTYLLSHPASGHCIYEAEAYDAGHAAAYLEPATFTITEGHSPAAAAYAASRWVVDSNGYHEAAQAYDAALASVTVPAEPITTAAELDALPDRSVVQDADSDTYEKRGDSWHRAEFGSRWTSRRLCEYSRLTLLAPASPPIPAPMLLTDPDDPRIRVGAVLARQFRIGDLGVVGARVDIRNGRHLYLLAEAPDPDAEIVAALEAAKLQHLDSARDYLDALRGAGYDVTKRADR